MPPHPNQSVAFHSRVEFETQVLGDTFVIGRIDTPPIFVESKVMKRADDLFTIDFTTVSKVSAQMRAMCFDNLDLTYLRSVHHDFLATPLPVSHLPRGEAVGADECVPTDWIWLKRESS